MSKEKKVAVNFAVAVAIGLTVYLAGQLLLALMVVKGWVAETSAGPAQILLGGAGDVSEWFVGIKKGSCGTVDGSTGGGRDHGHDSCGTGDALL